MSELKTYKSICRMCGEGCGIEVRVRDGKVEKIVGNKEDPVNCGRICIKGSSAATWVNLENRLTKPLKKTENGFVEIELEQAMDEIAEKLLAIQKKYGDNAIGVWKGEGIGFAQNEELARRFIHAVGSPNYFSNDTQCYAGRYTAFNLVYGCWPQADLRNSKLVILWGTNPPAAHSYWTQQINDARDKGAKLVVIDTKYTEIARQADIYVNVKPGCDGVLAWGVIREMLERGVVDYDFVEKFTLGFDELKAYAQTFTKDYVAQYCEIDGEVISQIVDLLDAARPHITSWPGTGLEHQQDGVNSVRATTYVDVLAGAIDQKGGMLVTQGMKINNLEIYDEKPLLDLKPIGADTHPVLYHMRKECHTLELMDQILSEKPYPFKGLVMSAANPALTNANTGKVLEALSKLELLVVKDLFLTETAELADYVLPAASYLEREELHYNAAGHYVFLSTKTSDKGLQTEYELFKGLADRMGAGSYFPWKNDHELNEWLIEPSGLTMEQLQNNPSGVRHTEIEYKKHERKLAAGEKPFNTPSGKVEFTSEILKQYGYEPLGKFTYVPDYIAKPDAAYPYLMMTGARKPMFFHGRYRNIEQLRKAVPHGQIEMHPTDAAKLNVVTGDRVRVTSRKGSIEIDVLVMNEKEIHPGSVQITHGFKHENVNLLTDDDVRDPISGFPALKSVMVNIEKI